MKTVILLQYFVVYSKRFVPNTSLDLHIKKKETKKNKLKLHLGGKVQSER